MQINGDNPAHMKIPRIGRRKVIRKHRGESFHTLGDEIIRIHEKRVVTNPIVYEVMNELLTRLDGAGKKNI